MNLSCTVQLLPSCQIISVRKSWRSLYVWAKGPPADESWASWWSRSAPACETINSNAGLLAWQTVLSAEPVDHCFSLELSAGSLFVQRGSWKLLTSQSTKNPAQVSSWLKDSEHTPLRTVAEICSLLLTDQDILPVHVLYWEFADLLSWKLELNLGWQYFSCVSVFICHTGQLYFHGQLKTLLPWPQICRAAPASITSTRLDGSSKNRPDHQTSVKCVSHMS